MIACERRRASPDPPVPSPSHNALRAHQTGTTRVSDGHGRRCRGGRTALHVFADVFRERAEAATNGAVTVRLFPSGTLGQEREVVQQLQEGLVDFMVSGTAIWGSVAPKLQGFDFPFLWRDADHVHQVVDGGTGREAADYLERVLRVRPIAWGDSFGFRQVITRS